MEVIEVAENYLSTEKSWYPREASRFHGRVFMNTLQQVNPDLHKRASDFFNIEKAFLKTTRMKANLSSLKKMIEREEQKEDNLLKDIFQKDNYRAMDAGQRISIINALYNTKDQFQRNISKIQAIQGNKGGGRIDITTEFSRFLGQEINNFIETKGIQELSESDLKGCLEIALKRLINYTDRKTGLQPYAELADAMNQLAFESGQSWILDELFSVYFGVPMREVQKQLSEETAAPKLSAEKTKKSVWGDYFWGSKKGNVMEAIEALTQDIIQKQFGGKTFRTGATGMKADNIVTYKLEVDLDQFFKETETEKDRSVRARSVELLEKMFDKIGSKGGYIVEISDKNYSLTSSAFAENKGFAAQTKFKLANLEKLLDKMFVAREDINSLMFVLANTDEQLVGGADAEDMCKFISTYIGYFLFDDLQIDDNSYGITTQAIHLFNLDGIYIPLSVFLNAALYAFENLPEKSADYVNVTFESKFNYKRQTDGLQEEDWTKLYQDRMNESSIDIHFFGDFINFIKTNIKL